MASFFELDSGYKNSIACDSPEWLQRRRLRSAASVQSSSPLQRELSARLPTYMHEPSRISCKSSAPQLDASRCCQPSAGRLCTVRLETRGAHD